jgi:hypothetical protein
LKVDRDRDLIGKPIRAPFHRNSVEKTGRFNERRPIAAPLHLRDQRYLPARQIAQARIEETDVSATQGINFWVARIIGPFATADSRPHKSEDTRKLAILGDEMLAAQG